MAQPLPPLGAVRRQRGRRRDRAAQIAAGVGKSVLITGASKGIGAATVPRDATVLSEMDEHRRERNSDEGQHAVSGAFCRRLFVNGLAASAFTSQPAFAAERFV
jgi:hypothetical protein